MNTMSNRCAWILTGALWVMVSVQPAIADDTELFVSDTGLLRGNVRPNVLLILDSSGSMRSEVLTQPTYDPTFAFDGSCDANRVYWRSNTGDPPLCGTDQWIERSALACDAAISSFSRGTGYYSDLMAQYDPDTVDQWVRIDQEQQTRIVECEDDRGVHGDGSVGGGGMGMGTGSSPVYAQDGDDNQLWSNNALDEVSWGQSPTDRIYTIYDGNYLNWLYGPTAISTRTQVLKDVATDLLSTLDDVNVGLMRFNQFEGGPVIHAIEDVSTARGTMTAAIQDLPASGDTPLSETLYEAGQYFAGRRVDFGNIGQPEISVASSRRFDNFDVYDSPLEFGCQKNFIVLLSDGTPEHDVSANAKIPALPGFSELVGASCDGSGDGACLDDMAAYLLNADLDPNLPGKQSVVTHTIGFTIDLPLYSQPQQREAAAPTPPPMTRPHYPLL